MMKIKKNKNIYLNINKFLNVMLFTKHNAQLETENIV